MRCYDKSNKRMLRYFIEVAYVGTRYSGFQVQHNANTIQAEVSRALKIIFNKEYELSGSSRTDAGVHAFQNFFHFDSEAEIHPRIIYNLNALLPYDIVIRNIFETKANAHCRFDALARTYEYNIIRTKDPFQFERAYYFPYTINENLLHEMAEMIVHFTDFTSFSKKHTKVKSFTCHIQSSKWSIEKSAWKYEITADRFLRGMVKGLTGSMLRIAKNNGQALELVKIFEKKDASAADFSVPSCGLFLKSVLLKENILMPNSVK